jgi:hypothetical protein
MADNQSSPSLLSAIPLALLVLRQVMQFVTLERARTGKTVDEIFADAGLQIDANELALLTDLEKYNS